MALTIDDIEDLKELKEQADGFTQHLFDFISPLGQHALYQHLIDLKIKIEDTITELEGADNGD